MASNKETIMPANEQRFNRVKFFKTCDAMRQHYEVLAKCRTRKDAAELLAKEVGFTIPVSVFKEAAECCSLQFHFKANRPMKHQAGGSNNVRDLCDCVVELYERLGAEMPEKLKRLKDYYAKSRHGKPSDPPVANGQTPVPFPVPVKSVPDPRTIPIVPARR